MSPPWREATCTPFGGSRRRTAVSSSNDERNHDPGPGAPEPKSRPQRPLRKQASMELINEDSPRRSLANVRVGANVRFFNFVNGYGCEIGDNTKIGSFVEIQK